MASSDTTTITAHCLCKANTFTLPVPTSSLPLDNATFCHATAYRHLTGTLALGLVKWPGALPDLNPATTTRYSLSPHSEVIFCSACGTFLFKHNTDSGWVAVATGSLTDPASWCRFTAHTFVSETKDGGLAVMLGSVKGKELKAYEGCETQDGEGLLAEGWQARMKSASIPDEEETEIAAHCQCRGVSFKVTKASEESADPSIDPRMPQKWYLNDEHTRFRGAICLCDSCRLACGQEMQAWTFIPDTNLFLPSGEPLPSPPLFGTMKVYRSSEDVGRYFCGTCGATVFYVPDQRPRLPDLAVGVLDAKSGARAEELLFWPVRLGPMCKDGFDRGLLADELLEGMKAWEAVQGVGKAPAGGVEDKKDH